ncbi:hypothetical protein TNCV_1167141 [Trichonephila clavipes]|uniref:Uncharacterized protein n=1 Tax=Trichonephila clavipes TaxID=2585209 RepID=A0A8X6SX13_TRICX|nr:hypothetical protein TNCV_1167141 [Trichonephila clavipes]
MTSKNQIQCNMISINSILEQEMDRNILKNLNKNCKISEHIGFRRRSRSTKPKRARRRSTLKRRSLASKRRRKSKKKRKILNDDESY